MFKKAILFNILFLFICYTYADSTSLNFLTRGRADTYYMALIACADGQILEYNLATSTWECGNDDVGGGGGGAGMWIDGGSYLYPNSTYASNVIVYGYIYANDWTNVSITESQIKDLAHIGNCSGTNCNIGCGNITGADYDVCVNQDTTCSGQSCDIANTGTLDGYEASELLGGGGGENESIFYNITHQTYLGSLSIKGSTGYEAANFICNSNFTGTHLCHEHEILQTPIYKNISQMAAWTGFGWYIAGAAKYAPASYPADDCHGFTQATSSYIGNFMEFDASVGGGYPSAGTCNYAKALACCKVY